MHSESSSQLYHNHDFVIAPAQTRDLAEILALFDEAAAWLVHRGIDKQWGTTPPSEVPSMRERFSTWINQGTLFVARWSGLLVGTLALNENAPEYVAHRWQRFPASALYLEALATARLLAGQGIGRALLRWAEQYARQAGKTSLWLDCWAENEALCHYYEQAGFIQRGTFLVGEAWRGQLFEKAFIGHASE